MNKISENKFLTDLLKEFESELPKEIQDITLYEEIERFKDYEYIYCIAYEMLIRTDEYTNLLEEYDNFIKTSSNDLRKDEFTELNRLIQKMNNLGLKKTSFLGFDTDDDSDNVFKRIDNYKEVLNSPWNVRMLHKFELDPALGFDSIFHMLIDFYNNKNELYVIKNDTYTKISLQQKHEQSIETNFINKININDLNIIMENLFIPSTTQGNNTYQSIKDIIYLKELDEEFLSLLKEKKVTDLLIPIKSTHSMHNIEYWNKYSINDIKDGFDKLIEYHTDTNQIYNKNSNHVTVSKQKVCDNPSHFYIPCVNRLSQPRIIKWEKFSSTTPNNDFLIKLENDGHKAVVANQGYILNKNIDNIYLIQLDPFIPLCTLDDDFINTLKYEDLKNNYINTEPLFSRPRLVFDEARLVNIPINLNISKEELLLYISQIKDDFDKNKNIVKDDIEYMFDLSIESDATEIPENVKHVHTKSKTKRLLPNERKKFKKSLATAFYIYDLYTFFYPLFEKKRKLIQEKRDNEIKTIKENFKNEFYTPKTDIEDAKSKSNCNLKNYEINNLITEIGYLCEPLTDEQIVYYLVVMKEFIHGTNQKGENNPFKKQYNPNKKDKFAPKYKDLIIGDSYILKSTRANLIKSLFE